MTNLDPATFHGETVRSTRADGLTLVESSVPPLLRTSLHTHESSCLCVLRAGHFDERFGSRTRHCSGWAVLFRPAGERHQNDFGQTGALCLNIDLGARSLEERTGVRWPETSLDFTGGAVVALGRKIYRELDHADAVSPLVIEAAVEEILASIWRLRIGSERRPPRWLQRGREYIHANATRGVTLRDAARIVDVHPAHFAREFRRHYRGTVGDLVRELRVASACTALQSSDRSIVEIALESGFSDQAHFTRFFTRNVGTSPAAFRRQRIEPARRAPMGQDEN